MQKLIANAKQMTSPPIQHVLYIYGEHGNHIPELQRSGVETLSTLPSDEKLSTMPQPFLLIIDDYVSALDPIWISDIYTKKAHHKNFFVITLCQDLFDKKMKVPRINSQYIVLMRSPQAALSIRNLATQLFPGKVAEFLEIFEHATRQAYTYLLIDLHPITNPKIRLRKNIFPGELHGVYQFT